MKFQIRIKFRFRIKSGNANATCLTVKRIRYAHAPADLRSIVWRISTPVPGPCRGKSRGRFRPSSRSIRYRRSPASESRLSRWYSVRPRSTVSDRSLWVACETRLEDNRSILTSWMKRDAIGKFHFNGTVVIRFAKARQKLS